MKTAMVNVNTLKGASFSSVLKSVGVAYALTFALILIFSALLCFTDLPESTIALGLIFIAVLSNFVAGALMGTKAKTRGLINGALGGIAYLAVLYVIGLALYGKIAFDQSTVAMLIICLTAGSVGGIFGVNLRTKRRR